MHPLGAEATASPGSFTVLLKYGAIYLLARLAPGAVAFASLVTYTHLLSPDDYGVYVLVITTAILVQVNLFSWLELALLRLLPGFESNPGRLLSTVLCLFLGLVGATAALACVAWFLVPDPTLRRLLVIGLPILWAHAWLELNLKMCQSALMPIRYGILLLLRSTATLCVGVALVLNGLGAYGPLLGFLAGTALACVAAVSWQWRNVRPGFDPRLAGELARYGLPLMGSTALVFIIDSADRFMIARFLGTEAVGVYSAAYDLASQPLQLLMMAVNLAAYPLAIRAYDAHGVSGALAQLRTNGTFLLAISLPAAVGMVVLSAPLTEMLLGEEFRTAARFILPWVAVGILLAGLKVFLFDMAFQLSKRSGAMMWSVGVAAVCNVALNLWLIPRFGVVGAAWATVLSYTVALVVCIALGRRLIPIQIAWDQATRIAVASLLMALVVISMSGMHGILGLCARILAGAAIYGLVLVLLNVMDARTQVRNWLGHLSSQAGR